jgi:EAL domain-containing protein (putative c-di-GMP-specific phosphodiesterase class I)
MLKLGCENIQGYLFSRPLPALEMQQLLAHTLTFPTSAGATGGR